jgi:uncharacterized membrane protein
MKSKWVAIVLIGSLALNLALAGFLLGSRSQQVAGQDPTRAYPRWARSLPEPRREALRPVMMKHMRAMRPKVRTLRQQQRALAAAMQGQQFDTEGLQIALAEMRAEHERIQRTSHESFTEFVAQLTQAERQALAQDMSKHRRHPPREGDRGRARDRQRDGERLHNGHPPQPDRRP